MSTLSVTDQVSDLLDLNTTDPIFPTSNSGKKYTKCTCDN